VCGLQKRRMLTKEEKKNDVLEREESSPH